MAKRKANAEDNKESESSSSSSSSSSSTSEVKVKIEKIDELERTGGSDNPVDVLDASPPLEELEKVAKKARSEITTKIANRNFYCPITQCLMVNPVIAADGNTYEMSAVVDHIKLKKTSPMDNVTKISVKGLVVNRALKNIIEDFVTSPECPADMKEDYEETKKELDRTKAKNCLVRGRFWMLPILGIQKQWV